MTDRPIIFSTPMVCALLDGKKTQTRRIVSLRNCTFGSISRGKFSKLFWEHANWNKAWTDRGFPDENGAYRSGYLHVPCHDDDGVTEICVHCQEYGWAGTAHRLRPDVQAGDRLWVRESAYFTIDQSTGKPAKVEGFFADGPNPFENNHTVESRPSIHMPRWASRLTLEATGVKVERLQDISEADAIAEGVNAISMQDVRRQAAWSARGDFAGLWNHINGEKAWDANPFVVAITFKVIKANIDAPEALAA